VAWVSRRQATLTAGTSGSTSLNRNHVSYQYRRNGVKKNSLRCPLSTHPATVHAMQRSSADTSLTAVACTTAIWLGRHGFYRHPPDLIIPSFLSHLHLKIMPDSVKECVKSKTAFSMDLPGNHVSILNTIKKKRIWWTLDIHLLPLVSLLYFLSFL
jgi:hypothetical protein